MAKRTYGVGSSASSERESGYDARTTFSRNDGRSSSVSSISSGGSFHQPGPLPPPRYMLPCEFRFAGCHLEFHPNLYDVWISHSTSHFHSLLPPIKTVCTFCDIEFDTSFVNTGEDREDRVRHWSWRSRLMHVLTHLENIPSAEPMRWMRPDFFLIQYMWENNILSSSDYSAAMKFTERPQCDGLLPLGSKIPQRERDEDRRSGEHYNLAREKRQQKKESRGRDRRPSKH
jgi:hypothetical protein